MGGESQQTLFCTAHANGYLISRPIQQNKAFKADHNFKVSNGLHKNWMKRHYVKAYGTCGESGNLDMMIGKAEEWKAYLLFLMDKIQLNFSVWMRPDTYIMLSPIPSSVK